jgi:hypothetical protein
MLRSMLLTLATGLYLAGTASAQSVPHKEGSVGQITGDNGSVMTWVAAGNGTHYGKYTESGHHAYFSDGSLFGVFTVIAADGATLSGSYEGSFTPIGGGFFQFDVSVEWLVGTGRLAGVTGTGSASAILDGATGQVVIQASGTWDHP